VIRINLISGGVPWFASDKRQQQVLCKAPLGPVASPFDSATIPAASPIATSSIDGATLGKIPAAPGDGAQTTFQKAAGANCCPAAIRSIRSRNSFGTKNLTWSCWSQRRNAAAARNARPQPKLCWLRRKSRCSQNGARASERTTTTTARPERRPGPVNANGAESDLRAAALQRYPDPA
jgi:hypothetical protein